MKDNAWNKYSDEKQQEVRVFVDGYKKYISDCKTERECTTEAIRLAETYGYVDLKKCIAEGTKLHAGDKVYYNHYGKSLMLFHIGRESLEKGLNILGAHIDSPRLDLKPYPLYEQDGLAMFKTHYYGGIKKYQWVTLPLALHGVVCKKDGTTVNVVIGEDDNDPVVGITDLLVHLSADQMQKPASKVIEAEDLNVTLGSIALKDAEKDAIKANIMKMLNEKYGIEEEDFESAEIEVVPAGKARDYGLDRSMVMGYGQDDRSCAYLSVQALFDVDTQDKTSCALIVDKEEIGSVGMTGMQSNFFENVVMELMELVEGYSELKKHRCLANSSMLSSDVSAGYDPNFAYAFESRNAAHLGQGMCFNKYTGSRGKSGCNDSNPEFVAKVRAAMHKHDVAYQMAELGKVDVGGGGTIAYIMAKYSMNVIDSGVAVLSMHAPWEITNQVDLYETYRGFKAFLEEM